MYRKIMEILRKRRREKGIAVVFVLGILGLLTVIGLGFASTALLDNKISSNNTNTGKARLLARSAYMRAFLLMREGAASEKIITRSTDGHYDWLWRLNTTLDGIDLFALPQKFDAESNNTLPSWQYVYDTSGTERQIVGRFAYVVKDEVGKMDPSVHFGKYLASKDRAVPLKRFGTSEAELDYLAAIDSSETIYKDVQDVLFKALYKKHEGQDIYSFASPFRWQDFISMMGEAYLDASVGGRISTVNEEKLRNVNETLQAGTPEVFWIDKDNDKVQTTDEMFHRFNLARTDWDKEYFDDVNILFGRTADNARIVSKVNGIDEKCIYNARPAGDKNLVRQNKKRDQEDDVGTADSCYDTGGVQWLGLTGADPKKNASGEEDESGSNSYMSTTDPVVIKRKQIAANIIQYCRKEDSRTVTDLKATVTDWADANAEPLYAGVGKHPMLNEVGFKVGISGTAGVTASVGEEHTVQWQYVIAPQIAAELIDMFNIHPDDRRNAQVRFFGKLSLDYYDITSGAYKNQEVKFDNVPINISQGDWTRSATDSLHVGYTNGTWIPGSEIELKGTVKITTDNPDGAAADLAKNLAVKNVKMTLSKIYLRYENSLKDKMLDRDFARIDKEFTIKEQDSGETKIVGDPKYFACAAAANDPRVNHNPADWTPLSIFKTTAANDPVKLDVGEVFDSEPDMISAIKQIATLGRNNFDPSESAEVHSANVTYTHRKFGYNSATKTFYENQQQYDLEDGMTDPANGAVSTAYIAQRPMLSLWELGAISRAEPWRTINLKKAVPHSADEDAGKVICGGRDNSLALGNGDAASVEGEGYQAGDGNILDQVKINRLYLGDEREKALGDGTNVPSYITDDLKAFWMERTHSFGKININTLQESVLKALFKGISFNDTKLHEKTIDERKAYYSFIGKLNEAEPGAAYDGTTLAGEILRDPAAGDEKKSTFFRTRADILLKDFYNLDFSNSSAAKNDAAQEQLIGKTMNLLKAEELDKAYIIAVAQTIKPVAVSANSPRYFDWNRDGVVNNDDAASVTNDKKIRTKYEKDEIAWKNAGYVRYPLARELHGDSTHQKDTRLRGVAFGSKTLAREFTGTKNKDTYMNGVDQITGTAKVVVTLEKVDGKWKVVRYEYVD